MRYYHTPKSLKAALRKQGIKGMAHEIRQHEGKGHYAHFFTMDREDKEELERRGFSAEINTDRAVKE